MINLTSYQHHFLIYVTLGCSATRRRQCSLFLLVSDFVFLPSSITFSSSLSIKYHLHLLSSFSSSHTVSSPSPVFQSVLLASLFFFSCFLSPSCEGLIDGSGFCQHRRGTLDLKAPLKPLDVDPSPLCRCDLSPFTLPPKQTGHDPPPESRSHGSLATRREEKDADGNQFSPKTVSMSRLFCNNVAPSWSERKTKRSVKVDLLTLL